MGDWAVIEWMALVERELLLFAGVFFLIGALDELLVDGLWAWLRLSGRLPHLKLDRAEVRARRLAGRAAICIPAWIGFKPVCDSRQASIVCVSRLTADR